MAEPRKTVQSVTREGASVAPMIDGVLIRPCVTHQDDRGTLMEIYSQAWKFDNVPLVHTYLVTVRPGKVKGWAVHHDQIDRYCFVSGTLKLVLFDDRRTSATRGMINELHFSEVNRSLVSVPPHVYHAVENIGVTDAVMYNLPSEPYDYASPDKYQLPLENDLIPYTFAATRGY